MTNFCHNCFATINDEDKCNICGYIALNDANAGTMLRPGTILTGKYKLGRPLGAGGFGITYLAQDIQNGQKVAVKEYLPAGFAMRMGDGQSVAASGEDNKKMFLHGLEVFTREARTLKLFAGANNIVQVMDSFDANGTSYFAMEYLDGITLGGLTKASGGKLNVENAIEILRLTASALSSVHAQGMLHRDVSPENIIITKQGNLKLIDFGATRYFVSEKSRSLSVVLKAGFAPPEQYSSKGNQGPWTDLYALCATFYTVIAGKRLPDAPDRLANAAIDNLRAYGVPTSVAMAVESGLALDYRVRPQNMNDFFGRLGISEPPPQVQQAPPQVQKAPPQMHQAPPQVQQVPPQVQQVPQNHNYPMPQHLNTKDLNVLTTPYVSIVNSVHGTDKWILPKNIAMKIGRSSESCNIVIDNKSISRIHCELRYDDKQVSFFLVDLSSNGTYINGNRLLKDNAYKLLPGNRFSIAANECVLEVGLC